MKQKKNESKVTESKLGKFEASKLNIKSSVKAGTGNTASLSDSDYTVTSTGYTAGDDWDFHTEG